MYQIGRAMKSATGGSLFVLLAGLLLTGCSQTAAPGPNIIQRAMGETPAPLPPTGFLGNDYSLLTPPAEGSDQKAMLRYFNPNANWSSYNRIMIAPVTYWAADDSKVSAADQQTLCNYMYTVLQKDLGKNFVIVDQPGPGVIKLSAALTDATSAVPVLRSVSVIVPQARALSMIKMAGHGHLRIRRLCPRCSQIERLALGTVACGCGRQADRRRIRSRTSLYSSGATLRTRWTTGGT